MQTVHPDGKDGHLLLSNNYSPTIADYALTPRVGATYTVNPDTVLRFSAGRYAQEPETYQVQYNAKDNNLAYDLFQAFWQYGYTTPRHDPAVQYSDNYDASYEQRFKGTDMSIKLTPYYRYADNQVYNISLPFGLTGGLNSGVERVDGVEFEFTKGDFDKNGLSFLFSYTYTNAAERWANFPGTSLNPIDPYNQDIANFNGLTAGRRRLAVLRERQMPATSIPIRAACGSTQATTRPIRNPYFTMSPQPLLDRNGWYPVGLDFAYLSPNVAQRDRQLQAQQVRDHAGADVQRRASLTAIRPTSSGIDPRTCLANSSHIPSAPNTTCRPTTRPAVWRLRRTERPPAILCIPNPQTGSLRQLRRVPSALAAQLEPADVLSDHAAHQGQRALGESGQRVLRRIVGAVDQAVSAQRLHLRLHRQLLLRRRTSTTEPRQTTEPPTACRSIPRSRKSYIPAYADTNSFVLPNPFNAYFSVNVTL